jgi:hypothetical protein
MAKDELAALGLDDDEIELIKSRRKQRKEQDEREVRIRTADGHEATLPFATASGWLRKIGVLLDDDEPGAVDAAESDEEAPGDDEPGKTVRFGRRVS